jgi:hypothetical protein
MEVTMEKWWTVKIVNPQPLDTEDYFETEAEKEAYRKGLQDGYRDGYDDGIVEAME